MDDFNPHKLTIHVVAPEHAVNFKWEKGWDKVSKNLELKSIDELNSLSLSDREKYFGISSFEEGMVLILDPINKRYYNATSAVDEIPQNKNRAIDHIASLLGAKRIERKVVHYDLKKRELAVDGKLNVHAVSANASYKESEKMKTENRFSGIKEFKGNLTMDGYQKAKDYCEQTGLIHDPAIRRMLEDRNPNHPNRILKESYNVKLTDEVEGAMEAAFSLSYLKCFSVSAKICEVISTERCTELSLEIEYGD